MKRIIIVLITLVLIAAAIAVFPVTVSAQSAGCAAVTQWNGITLFEASQKTITASFDGGDIITVSGITPDGSKTIGLTVSGATTNSSLTGESPLSYAIPESGSYVVTLSNKSTGDLAITVGCGSGAGAPWTGYTDGRVNPDPAEYYSIWCQSDAIEIWRAVPPPSQMLTTTPINSVIYLPSSGGTLNLGNNMSLVRNTADTITVYGSNGNLAPAAGQKAFSLSACISRNGGVPAVGSTDDRDGDGVNNTADRCPDVAGNGGPLGCPDSDGDKIPDILDQCPAVAGLLSLHGCPDTDTDHDGIGDTVDQCPTVAGTASASGCPDDDGDTIPNAADSCPTVAGLRGLQGCPQVDLSSITVEVGSLTQISCYNFGFLAQAPDNHIPRSNTILLFPSIGNYTLLAADGSVITSGKWRSTIKTDGSLTWEGQYKWDNSKLVLGLTPATTLTVTFLTERDTLKSTRIIPLDSNCKPIPSNDPSLTLFNFAAAHGAYDGTTVTASPGGGATGCTTASPLGCMPNE